MIGVLRGLRQAGVLPVVLRNESRGLMAGQRRLMSGATLPSDSLLRIVLM
jgi:hypothetical protein